MQYVSNQLSTAYYWIPATTIVTLWTTIPTVFPPPPTASDTVKLAYHIANIVPYIFAAGIYGLFLYSNPNLFFAGFMGGIFAPQFVDKYIIQQIKIIYDRTNILEKAFILLMGAWIKMPITVPTLTLIATAVLGARMILRHGPLPAAA